MRYAKKTFLSQSGLSLVEVVISIGVMSVVSMVFAQLMVSQQKSLKYIEQKSDVQSTQNTLLGLAKEPTLCLCQFAGHTFDSNDIDGSQALNIGEVKLGCQDSSAAIAKSGIRLSSGVNIDTVTFDRLTPVDVDNKIWKGRWRITFANEGSVVQLKPIHLDQVIRINNDNPANATIEQCMGVALDASISCEMFGEGWRWDIDSEKCIAARAPAEEDCLRLGTGWQWVDGACRPEDPDDNAECVARYGTGWSYNGSTCIPPMTTAELTCKSLGSGWVWDKNNSRCLAPAVRPVSSSDCTKIYGAGWLWNGSACVPPAQSSASKIYYKSGGVISNNAGAQTVYCNSGDTLVGVVTSFCGSNGTGNMEGVNFTSSGASYGAVIYCDVGDNGTYDGGILTLACMQK